MNNSPPLSIPERSAAIANGLSPVALVEECLHRIAEEDGAINAMVFVDMAGARAAARAAEREIAEGRTRGPLHGIPVAVKDVIDVAGWPTTAGSRLFDGYVAREDATCVANLKGAGAIVIGKANLHELTVGSHDNRWFGKVVNPLNRSRGTGGTSSGSAAAVAAGFCVAAVGTDTGGSNRSTAAATGLVGLKPSNGLIPAAGVRPTALSLDAVGPITATVADARMMVDAMPDGTLTRAEPATGRGISLADVVLAVCPDLYDAAVDPVIQRSHTAWLNSLDRAGVRIETLTFGDNSELVEAGLAILRYEFAREYAPLIERHPDRVADRARDFLAAALTVDEASFRQALDVRQRLTAAFLEKLKGVDVLAVPVAPGLTPRLSDECTRVGDAMVPYGLAGARFRLWANTFGMPALAVPLRTDGVSRHRSSSPRALGTTPRCSTSQRR
jgi:aspartyl-tRNA(Asn)/glutamyl-tRNA(Gln) amidotransferase subunit A